MAKNIYAVITGDLTGYSKLNKNQREKLISELKDILKQIEKESGNSRQRNRFSLFRGDSFQGIIINPLKAFHYALKIRTRLKMFKLSKININLDARIAIGIGKADIIKQNITESDGEAFRLSGPALDKMTSQQRLKIKTPFTNLNDEFDLICLFTDVILSRWTMNQSEVVYYLLNGYTQKAIADKLKITQAAVNQRTTSANWNVINAALKRYENLISEKFLK